MFAEITDSTVITVIKKMPRRLIGDLLPRMMKRLCALAYWCIISAAICCFKDFFFMLYSPWAFAHMTPVKTFDFIIYWSIVLMPFSAAVSSAFANVFIGFFIVSFIAKRILKNESILAGSPITLPFLLLIVASGVSFINSVSYMTSLAGLWKLFQYLFIFTVCAEEIKDRKHVSRIVFSIALGIFLVSIDAAWQIASGRDFIRGYALREAIGMIRPTASFNSPNLLGIYMGALIPLTAGLSLSYYKGRERVIFSLVSILAAAVLCLTFCRGAGMALYLSALFLSIAGKKKMLIIILAAALLILPFIMPVEIKEWVKKADHNPALMIWDRNRVSIYANTVNMIRHHPFIGVGVNTFSRNYGKYKLDSVEKRFPTSDTAYAHNSYLHMAGEIGLLGLGVFFWIMFILFKEAALLYRRSTDEYLKIITISLAACLMAYLINSLTETSFYAPRVVVIFWYLAGFSLALKKFQPVPLIPT